MEKKHPVVSIKIDQVDYHPTFEEPADDDMRRYEVSFTHKHLDTMVTFHGKHEIKSTDPIYMADKVCVFRGHVWLPEACIGTSEMHGTLSFAGYTVTFSQTGVTIKHGDVVLPVESTSVGALYGA